MSIGMVHKSVLDLIRKINFFFLTIFLILFLSPSYSSIRFRGNLQYTPIDPKPADSPIEQSVDQNTNGPNSISPNRELSVLSTRRTKPHCQNKKRNLEGHFTCVHFNVNICVYATQIPRWFISYPGFAVFSHLLSIFLFGYWFFNSKMRLNLLGF